MQKGSRFLFYSCLIIIIITLADVLEWKKCETQRITQCSCSPGLQTPSFVAFLICRSTLPSLDLRMRRFKSSAKKNKIALAPIELLHGDFLNSPEVRDAVSCAGLVFMNNPKFGCELNLRVLRELCPLMPNGCKLVLLPPQNSCLAFVSDDLKPDLLRQPHRHQAYR
jgi:hypothetical protein